MSQPGFSDLSPRYEALDVRTLWLYREALTKRGGGRGAVQPV